MKFILIALFLSLIAGCASTPPKQLSQSAGRTNVKWFDLSELDKKPKALYQVEPTYPYTMRLHAISGWVDIEWVITRDGDVTNVRVIESSREEFEANTIAAIYKSKWKPGIKDNQAVATRVRQKITFNRFGGDGPYNSEELDTQPKLKTSTESKDDSDLNQENIDTGWVELEFIVSSRGSVYGAKVIKSSDKSLEETALKTIYQSLWTPGEIDGRKVPARITHTRKF